MLDTRRGQVRLVRHMDERVGTDVARAARLLEAGELVAIPTETVYGLAASALDAEACLRVFEAKQRPFFDPLIVHLASLEAARGVVADLPPAALELANRFWPGPLTLVLPRSEEVPDVVTSGLETVAVRCPDHPLTRQLLERLSFPLAAPSANPFGGISPTTPQHVLDGRGDRVAYVLDGGPCSVGVESTIVGWESQQAVLHRPGGVPLEALEELLGPLGQAAKGEQPVAPGALASHYAPRTPLELGDLDELLARHGGRQVGVLAFSRPRAASICRVLSTAGELHEAAHTLFACLRELDAAGCEVLLAEPVPDEGLGRAINDRLRRAAAPR